MSAVFATEPLAIRCVSDIPKDKAQEIIESALELPTLTFGPGQMFDQAPQVDNCVQRENSSVPQGVSAFLPYRTKPEGFSEEVRASFSVLVAPDGQVFASHPLLIPSKINKYLRAVADDPVMSGILSAYPYTSVFGSSDENRATFEFCRKVDLHYPYAYPEEWCVEAEYDMQDGLVWIVLIDLDVQGVLIPELRMALGGVDALSLHLIATSQSASGKYQVPLTLSRRSREDPWIFGVGEPQGMLLSDGTLVFDEAALERWMGPEWLPFSNRLLQVPPKIPVGFVMSDAVSDAKHPSQQSPQLVAFVLLSIGVGMIMCWIMFRRPRFLC
ncbi:MAG: hypothetical protein AAB853_01965 [Patescibacteria group bacterium]